MEIAEVLAVYIHMQASVLKWHDSETRDVIENS